MSVPKFVEFLDDFLYALEDSEIHSLKDIKAKMIKSMELTEEDLDEKTRGGGDTAFANRVSWTSTYLKSTGLIESPYRANYRITQRGLEALKSGEAIDFDYLKRFESFNAFQNIGSNDKDSVPSDLSSNESPIELLESAYRQIDDMLASELLEEVMKLSPSGFEELVVELLLKMGYGNGIDDAGKVTQPTNDGGIDGVIKEDQLGFSSIYIQAKRWNPDKPVGRDDIQGFVGALLDQQAQNKKGLFITTSKFTTGAIDYAKRQNIVLVDGEKLTKLMIKHNLGVSPERTFVVKKIDTDYFEELN